MPNPFTARWTLTGNNICLGEWDIRYQNRPVRLPPGRRDKDLGTYGIFSYIFPDDEEFAEGLREDDWILENIGWLTDLLADHDIPIDEAHMRWFYQAVNPQDWRCGSCGGCI